MESPTVIEINGTEYYVPSDYIDYLIVVDNHLVNIGNNTITLYHNFREYNVSNSGYPRITCPANTYAYITQSYSSGFQTLNVSSYEIKNRSFNDLFLIGVLIFGVLAMILFKKR